MPEDDLLECCLLTLLDSECFRSRLGLLGVWPEAKAALKTTKTRLTLTEIK